MQQNIITEGTQPWSNNKNALFCIITDMLAKMEALDQSFNLQLIKVGV